MRSRKIGKPYAYNRRVLREEVRRPGFSGLWNYHATKGWRKTREKLEARLLAEIKAMAGIAA